MNCISYSGDMMILNEYEVKTCLIYALKPVLNKYEITLKDVQLSIDEHIGVKAQVIHQERLLDLIAFFDVDYREQCFCFENIKGKIEYLFLSMNLMSVLQQFNQDDKITFSKDCCFYKYELPIQKLKAKDQQLLIELKK